ncbi:SMP-30/gluconolactonase/LRE family protein [Tropicimonas sediminicola]|uniref:Sugar lactone lactonase YvrE n=1 Tax=Tropicimonas sediminicola TaxID=1031541 RepID=A0A239HYL3_9RHOB|nr:SMP-30/gluconolactonase/LRE family protein [Tropicimonas sediminicola]SNS85314.1 Sugar lactone lactonase YvrE [Tropicimonas sediminicola]
MLQKADTGFRRIAQPMAITGKSPLWDETRGCLWWIDIQAQRLLRTRESGETTAIPVPSQPGFVALADSGRLVLGLENGLWTYAPESAAWEQVSETEADRPTVRLNDGKPDSRGRLWFGSMDMTHTGKAIGRLYRRDPGGEVTAMREGVAIPNAIVPCGNGRSLLFTDTARRRIELIDTDPRSGDITGTREILRIPDGSNPDGACMDADGNFWVAIVGPGEVLRISPSGRCLQRLRTPVTRPTSVVIGGPDDRTLFVTDQRRFLPPSELARHSGAGGLHAIQLGVRASPVHRVGGL